MSPQIPTDSLLSEKGRRIAGVCLELLETEVGKLKRGEASNLEKMDCLSNMIAAASTVIIDDEDGEK